MATFLLSAFVTQIRGSIGGTTFKKGRNSLIMSRKSFGGSRAKLEQNKRLGSLGAIFQAWSRLTVNQRTSFNEKATLFQFPDKNGVLKFLTGRQLFTKLNAQLITSNTSINNAEGMVSTVGVPTINTVSLGVVLQAGLIQIIGGTDGARFNLYAQKLPYLGASPDIKKAKFLLNNVLYVPGNYGLTPGFVNVFGPFVITDVYIFFVEEINAFGFKSTKQTKVATITT